MAKLAAELSANRALVKELTDCTASGFRCRPVPSALDWVASSPPVVSCLQASNNAKVVNDSEDYQSAYEINVRVRCVK